MANGAFFDHPTPVGFVFFFFGRWILRNYAIFSAITFWRASACYTTILCPYPTGPARQVV